MTTLPATVDPHGRVPSANVLPVGHRRLFGGLAIAAVPVLLLVIVTSYQASAYDDELSYRYAVWSVPLLAAGAVGAAALLLLRFVRAGRRRRRGQALVAAVLAVFLLAWFGVLSGGRNAENWSNALVCVPTTLFSVVMCRRVERNRRLPWPLVAVAFVWGMWVAPEYSGMTSALAGYGLTDLVAPGRPFAYVQALVAGVNEEAVKAVGVLAILFALRHRVNGALGGLATGAVVGAGFQFAESALYMAAIDSEAMIYQYWMRQYLTLFASHTVYTGIAGAALGLAFQQRGLWRKAVCALSGYVAAVAAHTVWNVAAWTDLFWRPDDPALLVFAAMPLNVLVFHGPFVVLLAVLAIAALRFEVRGLVAELRREARTGLGAILPDEVGVLARASARFRMRLRLYRRRDYARYRYVRTLHAAQIDLAFARWHRARGDFGVGEDVEHRLRQRVRHIRRTEPPPPPLDRRPDEPLEPAAPGSTVSSGHLS
ncbi:PrsW family intramembrane metalloprotease [Spirillospora sp. CA-255316]